MITKEFIIGIGIIVFGCVYLLYSLNILKKRTGNENYISKWTLMKDLIMSVFIIIGGIVYLLRFI